MPEPSTVEIISFGPYALCPSQRSLTKSGQPVKIGGRAFDLLTALAENAGSVVSHKELIKRAWPGIFVEEVSLRVRIADLRKVLEQGDDERYLANVPGRGYSFVAQVSRTSIETRADAAKPRYNLPALPALIVGRAETTAEISRALMAGRLTSIVGPGGIGKTTVALSVAWSLLNAFEGEVCFVELSPLGDPALLPSTVVSSFGLPVQAQDPIPALIKRLSGRPTLLVLDSAEHLIFEAAALAERLIAESATLHVLVTSREALRISGENAHQLRALESPPDDLKTLAEIGTFSAAHLFLMHCSSGGEGSEFSDSDAGAIAGICRKLGGLALALELAAARVKTHGLDETVALLDSEFALRWPGDRAAPQRHQTLNATLDWSYNLLGKAEQAVLRRLSVFAGHFTLLSARHVAAHTDIGDGDVLEALNGLVSKCLVSIAASGDVPGFRLLDTTRTYAAGKLAEAGEVDALRRRQATYYCNVLRNAVGDPRGTGDAADIDNIRAALRWAFSKGGDTVLGADLAAYSAPIWLSKALLSECHAWMSKVVAVHSDNEEAAHQLMLALMAQGVAEFQMGGMSKETTATWMRILELAEELHDAPRQLFAHVILWTRAIRESWYADALVTAERFSRASERINDPAFRATSQWVLGHTKHHLGRQKEVPGHFNASLDADTEEARLTFARAGGIDRRSDLSGIMGNTLWLTGFPDKAARWGERGIAEARELKLDMSVGAAMIWAGLNTYLSETDTGAVERDMVELLEHARSFSADSEAGFALSILGLCQARRGELDAGRQSLREGLRHFADAHVESFSPLVLAHFCEIMLAAKRVGDAVDLMSELKARDRNPEHFCTPEILRVRARLAIAQGTDEAGENLFHDAIAMAERQGALSWKLRAATSFGQFLISRRRDAEARDLLQPIYARFSEGFGTADLLAARDTLSKLKKPN